MISPRKHLRPSHPRPQGPAEGLQVLFSPSGSLHKNLQGLFVHKHNKN